MTQYNSIREIPREEFLSLAKESESRRAFFRKIGLSPSGSKYKTFNKYLAIHGGSLSHFKSGPQISAGLRTINKEECLKKHFVQGSKGDTSMIRRYVARWDLVPSFCNVCGNKGEHLGRPLVLQLDHRNGIPTDNRLSNLRFLCPNCHSQTPTFGSLNAKRKAKPRCPACWARVHKVGVLCQSCSQLVRYKTNWPSPQEMERMVLEKPMEAIGSDLGVSGKAVAKFCSKHGIPKPSRGSWQKLRAVGRPT